MGGCPLEEETPVQTTASEKRLANGSVWTSGRKAKTSSRARLHAGSECKALKSLGRENAKLALHCLRGAATVGLGLCPSGKCVHANSGTEEGTGDGSLEVTFGERVRAFLTSD